MRRVKVYDEKTGDPWVDNLALRKNRIVNRVCRNRNFTVDTPRGWKHKRYIMNQEFPKYVKLVAAVADYLKFKESL